MLKTSGSTRERVINGRYADERHLQYHFDLDELPSHESIKATQKFYNGKISCGPLVRFLRSQVGKDWDHIYAEVVSRIPTKLQDYEEMVFWFVADKVEFIDGTLWNKKSQQFIWTGEENQSLHMTGLKKLLEFIEFYVHPDTNKLVRIGQQSFKRLMKKTE